ncbi:hypothetical protein ASJ81_18545 [Methanosarcina spelaei]|uniref:Uncharacterized protein n=1 Tax=Methanosarcina spelaei TaxID=1036679 RepID=A0A2A2HV51_9EURY|nr:hypothetical protein ASJ81_18545 [Methanosarcina spelaei]
MIGNLLLNNFLEFAILQKNWHTALKWVIPEKCDVVARESTNDFWVPIYDSLIDRLPVIVINARDMKAFTHKKPIGWTLNSSHNLHLIT